MEIVKMIEGKIYCICCGELEEECICIDAGEVEDFQISTEPID